MSNTNSNASPPSRDSAINQYGVIMSYLAYENSALWTRFGIIAGIELSLFGFAMHHLASIDGWTRIPVATIAAILGFSLTGIWQYVHDQAGLWTERWHDALREIEPSAFGELHLLRRGDTPDALIGGPGIKKVMGKLIEIAKTIWIVTLGFCAVASIVQGIEARF